MKKVTIAEYEERIRWALKALCAKGDGCPTCDQVRYALAGGTGAAYDPRA